MSTFIMSDKYHCFVKEIEKTGHTIVPSDTIKAFPTPEQQHADMQVLRINKHIFVLQECESIRKILPSDNLTVCKNKAGGKYPENILLNFLFFNNILYGKTDCIEPELLIYCKKHDIPTVNINQGYARCSTLVVSEKAAVTADITVKNALEKDGAEVLLINHGYITLDGYDYGFIGGSSGKIDDKTIAFFGNIKKHPDYEKIKKFCNKFDVDIITLCKNKPLTDVGGLVKIL